MELATLIYLRPYFIDIITFEKNSANKNFWAKDSIENLRMRRIVKGNLYKCNWSVLNFYSNVRKAEKLSFLTS